MQKIDFVNSQQPAINDTNLNLMQQYIENAIQGAVSGDTLPVGAIIPFGGGAVPDNYLLCDGSAVSRTTYAQLFSIIGTFFGVGDGSTTFNVPNMKGKVPVGYDSTQTEFNSLGKTGGAKTVTLTINQIPEHDHNVQKSSDVDRLVLMAKAQNTYGAAGNGTGSGNWEWNRGVPKQGGGQPHNNLQPYTTTNYIIKAFQTAGTVAQIVNTHNTSLTDAYSASISNGTTLYANSSGTNSTFSLSTSAANYTRLVIHYFETRNNQYSSVEILSPDGKKVALSNFFAGTSTYLNTAVISISGTSVTWETNRRERISDGQQDTDHIIKITDVIGYKY